MLCWSLCRDHCVCSELLPNRMRGWFWANRMIQNRTVRTMLSENSTANTQARAFSFFAFSGNLGIFLGPLIGKFPSRIRVYVHFS